jgi:DNA-directed RNA polymerase subunit RPC12/RpoP
MKLTVFQKVESAGSNIRRKCVKCSYSSTIISPSWLYCPMCGAKVLKKGGNDGKVFITER